MMHSSLKFHGPGLATPLHYMEFSRGQIIQESNEQVVFLFPNPNMMYPYVKFPKYITYGLGVWTRLHVEQG